MGASTSNTPVPIQRFEVELRRIARLIPETTREDPLGAIVAAIVEHPAHSESRLLARLLTAVTYQRGEFRVAEAAVFSSGTLGLIIGLLDRVGKGDVSAARCRSAVTTVEAAQLRVDS